LEAESACQFQSVCDVADFGDAVLPGHGFENESHEVVVVSDHDVDRVAEVMVDCLDVDMDHDFCRAVLLKLLRTLLYARLNLLLCEFTL